MRFTFIDGLRGIAALSVVLFHAFAGGHTPMLHERLPALAQWPLLHGNLGVSIFFVLSGFVIAHSLTGLNLTPGMAGRFMLRRSLRLDPPYWFAIALGCAMMWVKHEPISGEDVAAHFVYAQEMLGIADISTVFWTLCLEVQFYLIFAVLLTLGSRIVLIGAFILSLPLSQIVIWHGLFTSLWYGFLLGVLAYAAWKNEKLIGWFVLYAASLAALAWHGGDLFMATCVATASLILIVARLGYLTTAANWRPLQFVGLISYSLYLIHNPVIGVVFRIAPKGSLAGEIAGYLASVAVSIFAAWLMWLVVERTSMKLSRMVSLKPQGPQVRSMALQ
jgi:peptidoglycan/LPS O-acetylase OafA/YrhL